MKKILLLVVIFSLTACTSLPPQKFVADPDRKWEQRKSELSEINDWLLNGRIAIINGDESWHLSMKWQRHGDKYILDLSGPFGAGHAQLTGTNDGVILVDADKNYFYADSPDRLLHEVTGLQMPVKSLLYWMRGIADWNTNVDEQTIDEFGRLTQIKQNGWHVHYKRYITTGKYELPQKIFIYGVNLKVKIFIDEWDLSNKIFQSDKKN